MDDEITSNYVRNIENYKKNKSGHKSEHFQQMNKHYEKRYTKDCGCPKIRLRSGKYMKKCDCYDNSE